MSPVAEALVDKAYRKRYETSRARAALRGIALHAMDDDRGGPLYVASFHALTRQFRALGDVETWLDGVDEAHQSVPLRIGALGEIGESLSRALEARR